MIADAHERIYRKNYEASDFLVDAVDLCFELDPENTVFMEMAEGLVV